VTDAYDEIEIRVPVVSPLPTCAKNVIVRDRPEHYMGERGHDRKVYVGVGGGHSRLYLFPEEAEALSKALDQWKARRATLRCTARAEEGRS
jgi:hypothetical protein